jgi:hypothetical protein
LTGQALGDGPEMPANFYRFCFHFLFRFIPQFIPEAKKKITEYHGMGELDLKP